LGSLLVDDEGELDGVIAATTGDNGETVLTIEPGTEGQGSAPGYEPPLVVDGEQTEGFFNITNKPEGLDQ
jgi:hypothetical protein